MESLGTITVWASLIWVLRDPLGSPVRSSFGGSFKGFRGLGFRLLGVQGSGLKVAHAQNSLPSLVDSPSTAALLAP